MNIFDKIGNVFGDIGRGIGNFFTGNFDELGSQFSNWLIGRDNWSKYQPGDFLKSRVESSDFLNLLGDLHNSEANSGQNVFTPGQPVISNNNSGVSSLLQDSSINDQYNANLALQQQAQAFSSAEAEKERQWSENMSNTSYSRAIQDIRNAGLNPYLALSGVGASSFSGASASSSGSGVSKGSDSFSNIMKTAVSASAIVKMLKAIL